ncbi:MAG: HDOD domain-containing protein [Ignavibacteriae bacterium]|nr:HDOD domain-containing protein [Ignavibacteriota bacterium]
MLSPDFIRDKVQTIIQLPALPAIAEEVVEMVENPKVSASMIGKVISTDQGLTTKVLKIANSAFYGFPKKISTVDFAIIVLGFDALREIVVSISLVSALQKKSDATFDVKKFWDHAIFSGVIARRLARDLGYRVSGEVFVGALLHDMGISILHQYFNTEYRKIIELVQDPNITWRQAEESVLGVTHAEIGGWLAERWNFPPTLVEAVAKHHTPLDAVENPELVSLIHCADVLAVRLSDDPAEFDREAEFNPDVLQRLQLDDPMLMEGYMTTYRNILQSDMRQFESMFTNAKV